MQYTFNLAQTGDIINIHPGIYQRTRFSDNVTMLNRHCQNSTTKTSFRIASKTNLTIQSTTGNPSDVVLLGGRPHYIDGKGKEQAGIQHALSIVNSTGITLDGISIVGNGNKMGNYIADSALNIVNSSGTLSNAIVSGNQGTTGTYKNPGLNSLGQVITPDGQIDQEGIALYGSNTNFTIQDSLITNNFHTGIMLYNGASATVLRNVISESGRYGGHSGKGHGITTYHFSQHSDDELSPVEPSCYDGDMRLRAYQNLVLDNSGVGILIRGEFTGSEGDWTSIEVVKNTLYGNEVGLRLGPTDWGLTGWPVDPPGAPADRVVNITSFDASHAFISTNMIENNTYSGVKIVGAPVSSSDPSLIRGGLEFVNGGFVTVRENSSFANKPNADFDRPTGNSSIQLSYNLCTAQSVCPTCTVTCYKNIADPLRDEYFQLEANSPLIEEGGACHPMTANCADISSYDSQGWPGTMGFDLAQFIDLCQVEYPDLANSLSIPSSRLPICLHRSAFRGGPEQAHLLSDSFLNRKNFRPTRTTETDSQLSAESPARFFVRFVDSASQIVKNR